MKLRNHDKKVNTHTQAPRPTYETFGAAEQSSWFLGFGVWIFAYYIFAGERATENVGGRGVGIRALSTHSYIANPRRMQAWEPCSFPGKARFSSTFKYSLAIQEKYVCSKTHRPAGKHSRSMVKSPFTPPGKGWTGDLKHQNGKDRWVSSEGTYSTYFGGGGGIEQSGARTQSSAEHNLSSTHEYIW